VTVFSGYTSSFGGRTGPWGAIEPHYGLDIAAPLGSPIRNWWGGTVKEVIHDGRCGVGLVIQSGPYEHIYCHLLGSGADGVYRCGGLQLQPGQRVRTGQLIARVGMSGRTTGPHLHWGMRYGGQWLDPAVILQAMARSRGAAARP
jgi:murein DD-endopeptidase MepM/ murein hydrolase activator NlpD